MKTARFCNNDEKGPPPTLKKDRPWKKKRKIPSFFS